MNTDPRLLTDETGKAIETLKEFFDKASCYCDATSANAFSLGIKALEAQLTKADKGVDRTELREKIARQIFLPYELKGWEFGSPQVATISQNCLKTAAKILALFGDIDYEALREAIDNAKIEIAELNKKLDDKEADLIEAKKQERERIVEWGKVKCSNHIHYISKGVVFKRECWECWQALKEGE